MGTTSPSLAEALKHDDPQKQLQYQTGAPGRAAVFHGHETGMAAVGAYQLGDRVLDPAERDALDGRRNSQGVVIPAPSAGESDA